LNKKLKYLRDSLTFLFSVLLIASAFQAPIAGAAQVTLRLNSVDNLSGILNMQIAEDPNNPPDPIPFQQIYTFNTNATTLWVRVQDKALNWSSWNKVSVNGAPVINPGYSGTTPTPSFSASTSTTTPTLAPAPAGGGGGGGGGPKQTAAYFIIVDPANQGRVYSKSACIDVYSTDLFPQFKGQGCSKSDGLINLLLTDGGVTVRVYDAGYGSTYQVFHGKVENDTFTLEDAKYFAGTTRYAVYVLGTNANLNSLSPSPKPSNSITPQQANSVMASPTPAATIEINVSPTPSAASKTPTTAINAATSLAQAKVVSIASTSKVTSISGGSVSINSNIATKLKFNGLTKGSDVSISIKSPTGFVFSLPRSKVIGASYTSQGLKFTAKGTYLLTLSSGKVRKNLKIIVK
jgi:hypothetical protein